MYTGWSNMLSTLANTRAPNYQASSHLCPSRNCTSAPIFTQPSALLRHFTIARQWLLWAINTLPSTRPMMPDTSLQVLLQDGLLTTTKSPPNGTHTLQSKLIQIWPKNKDPTHIKTVVSSLQYCCCDCDWLGNLGLVQQPLNSHPNNPPWLRPTLGEVLTPLVVVMGIDSPQYTLCYPQTVK